MNTTYKTIITKLIIKPTECRALKNPLKSKKTKDKKTVKAEYNQKTTNDDQSTPTDALLKFLMKIKFFKVFKTFLKFQFYFSKFILNNFTNVINNKNFQFMRKTA